MRFLIAWVATPVALARDFTLASTQSVRNLPSNLEVPVVVSAANTSDEIRASGSIIVPSERIANSHLSQLGAFVPLEPFNSFALSLDVLVMRSTNTPDRELIDRGLNEVRSFTGTTVLVSETSERTLFWRLFDFIMITGTTSMSSKDACVFHLSPSEVCTHKFFVDSVETTCPNSSTTICAIKPRELTLAFLGDWGAVGEGLSGTAAAVAAGYYDRVIFGGDNIYEIGITNPQDPKMEEVYRSHFSRLAVPQHVIEGNHDGYGNYLAQLQYSQYNEWWDAPFYYFNSTWQARGTSACLVNIDTNQLELSAQRSFLINVLSSENCRNSDFVVVSGHHPIFSAGGHGDDADMIETLLPILTKYAVDVYLSGHDHVNSIHRDSGVLFVVAGAASKKTTSSWYTSRSAAEKTLFEKINTYGFAALGIQGGKLELSIMDSLTNTKVFQTTLQSRKSERMQIHAANQAVEGCRPWSGLSVEAMVVAMIVAWMLGLIAIQRHVVIDHAKSLF